MLTSDSEPRPTTSRLAEAFATVANLAASVWLGILYLSMVRFGLASELNALGRFLSYMMLLVVLGSLFGELFSPDTRVKIFAFSGFASMIVFVVAAPSVGLLLLPSAALWGVAIALLVLSPSLPPVPLGVALSSDQTKGE